MTEPRKQIPLRMPPDLHIRAANQAERAGISLNEWVIRCVEAVFTAHDKHDTNDN